MLFKVALRNLTRNPRRSLVTLLTVALGTGALFLFDGFNAGIMNQYRENTIHARYGHGQINTKGYRDQVFEKPWEHWIPDGEQVARDVAKISDVTHVFPRVSFFGLLTNDQMTVSGRGVGVVGKDEAPFFHTINVVEGDNLVDQEDGILLGIGLARSLNVKPGDRLTVLANTIHGTMNGLDLVVTGIFHTGSKDVDDVLFKIQLAQARLLLDTDRIESIALGLTSHEAWPEVAEVVERRFTGLEATPFAILDKVYYQHAVDWLGQQFLVIQLIILVIVMLGIVNTVSFTILERTQEIGNLRANGESVWDVMTLLSLEGLAIGALGGFLGLFIAFMTNTLLLPDGILMPPAPGLTRQYHVLIELQPNMAVLAFCLGAVTALIGTVVAGSKVARMPIGKALRAA